MRIARSDYINGVRADTARALTRAANLRPVFVEYLAVRMRADASSALDAAERLERAGYLERVLLGNREAWSTTALGGSLTMASFAKPIMRSTAERLLSEVIGRAERYNADDTHLLTIVRLSVFGSYLDQSKDVLGDLDIEFKLGRARPSLEAVKAYAARSGRSFPDPLDQIKWLRVEVKRLLRGGSRAISLRNAEDGELETAMRVVFEAADRD